MAEIAGTVAQTAGRAMTVYVIVSLVHGFVALMRTPLSMLSVLSFTREDLATAAAAKGAPVALPRTFVSLPVGSTCRVTVTPLAAVTRSRSTRRRVSFWCPHGGRPR